MERDKIPYRRGTIKYALLESDWSDCTAAEIAEVLDRSEDSVLHALCELKKDGYEVARLGKRRGYTRLMDKLVKEDWSGYTGKQIAAVTGASYGAVCRALRQLKAQGVDVPHIDGRKLGGDYGD